MSDPTLPPLPEPYCRPQGLAGKPLYTADQLRAAQLAAIEPYRRDAERYRWMNANSGGTLAAEVDAGMTKDRAMRQEGEK